MFEEQTKQELFEKVKAFHACKQEEGQSVSSYLLKMKSYLDTLERLGYAMPNELGMSLILNYLNKDYDQFIQNYNMHSMGKTIAELHAMLKLHEKGILKKAKTPTVLAIRESKIQKNKRKSQGVKGKDKGKNKFAYAPKPKISPPPKRDNLAKDSICQHCKEVVHWRRNCPSYQIKLKKRDEASMASPKRSKKLKHGALSLYMGNGMRAAVEAIGSFDLILPIEPLNVEVPIRRSARIPQAPDRYGFYVDAEEYELGDLDEPPYYKAALLVSEENPLKKFRMEHAKRGSIMYAVWCTRPDVAFARTSMEAVSMRKFIDGLGDVMPSNKRPMKMLCDNEHAIAIAADLDILKGARHFQRKYHYIRELIQEREIVLKKVHTDDNVAYLFTKPMSFNKHFEHVMATEIVSASSLM
ncbi:zinc finger, CCHC-type containing protein [Tanacetum coccineum]